MPDGSPRDDIVPSPHERLLSPLAFLLHEKIGNGHIMPGRSIQARVHAAGAKRRVAQRRAGLLERRKDLSSSRSSTRGSRGSKE